MSIQGLRASELAEMFSADFLGEDILITGVASFHSAQSNQIVFLANQKLLSALGESKAKVVVVKNTEGLPSDRSYLIFPDPALLFARIANYFHPLPASLKKVHASAVIAENVAIPADVEIGPNVVIEAGVILSKGVQIKAGTFIGANSEIGANTILMPRVVVYSDTKIGERCLIHSGAVIGSDGFGNAWAIDHWERIPQIGRVVIGDSVEIGANTTIDRGALDDTVIESGVRLDNLIQIAHNVKIGKNTAIAACTGIAGSAEIGAHCLIGGGVLIAGHLKVADKVTILAGSGVPSGITESGIYASGVPVVPHGTWLKNMVHFRKLDELAKKVKSLEKTVVNQQLNQGEKRDTN
jgi:UDP-3-O-[3-hydroxymyristoyl] glucosamine N-acyltransferase